VAESCNQENRFEALRRGLAAEFQRTKQVAHKLIDDLTSINGYAAIVAIQGGPEQRPSGFRKILDRSRKSMVMLQDCIANLHEVERRYS